MTATRIDLVRPDAPVLAAFGPHPVGVRTLAFTDPGRIDVVRATEDAEPPRHDRAITVEAWYPAAPGTRPGGTYRTVLRDGATPATLRGRAARDAPPAAGAFPLVLLSHGYPGNRFLLSHLGENLASKGYVVAAPDHPESTYDDLGPFASTLFHRPLDQRFVLGAMASLGGDLGAAVDARRVGLIGYSMGGYGALVLAGGGVTAATVARAEPAAARVPRDLLARHRAGSGALAALADPRLRAVVAIGPWGRAHDVWDARGLAGIRIPLLLMAGSQDEVSGYDAMRRIFEETTGTGRHLLTFEGAGHNAAAPVPAPAEAWAVAEADGGAVFGHYADPVWDTVRMNNVAQHFATAFLGLHLRGDAAGAAHLAADLARDTRAGPDAPRWPGFPGDHAPGLRLERRGAA